MVARGWCTKHYDRWRKHGDVALVKIAAPYEGASCSVDGCEAVAKSRGWCSKHYLRWRRNGSPEGVGVVEKERRCRVAGCVWGVVGRELCGAHYEAWRVRRRIGAATKERPGRRSSSARLRVARCGVDGCSAGVFARGLCYRHGRRPSRGSCGVVGCDGEAKYARRCERHQGQGRCVAEGCAGKPHARGLCPRHYYRQRAYGVIEIPGPRPCTVPGCGDRHVARGLCMRHYKAKQRHGSEHGARGKAAAAPRHGYKFGCRCPECNGKQAERELAEWWTS